MNRTQKGAWYGIFLAGMLSMVPLIDVIETMVNPVVLRVCGYVMAGVMVAPIYFIRKKRCQGEVDLDERDRSICKRGAITASIAVSIVLISAYLVILFVVGPKGAVSFEMLQGVIYGAFIVFILSFSVAILVQYGRGGKSGTE